MRCVQFDNFRSQKTPTELGGQSQSRTVHICHSLQPWTQKALTVETRKLRYEHRYRANY